MPTRDEVYLEYGRAAELAQLLETELGNILLGHLALTTQSYITPDTEAAKRLLADLDANTLGATLKLLRSRFPEVEPLRALLSAALEARNTLSHGFFLRFGSTIETADGQERILKRIQELRAPMMEAYSASLVVGQALFAALTVLRNRNMN